MGLIQTTVVKIGSKLQTCTDGACSTFRHQKYKLWIVSFFNFESFSIFFVKATDMRLEFVVAFNDSDSTAGWFQFFLGTTLYLSSTVEQTLDPMYSLNLRLV